MENNTNFPKNLSVPAYSRDREKMNMSTNYSSVTHPSMASRSREHLETIFKKINSGDNVLSRIPLRLDPNVEFSDDEDDEPAPTVVRRPTAEELKNKLSFSNEKENKLRIPVERAKTPEPPVNAYPIMSNIFPTEKKTSSAMRHSMFRSNFSESKIDCNKETLLHNREAMNRVKETLAKPSKVDIEKETSPQNHKHVTTARDSLGLFSKPKEAPLQSAPKHYVTAVQNKDSHQTGHPANSIKSTPSVSNEILEINGKIYNLLSLVGSGGSCKVYSVYDIENQILVAVKRVNLKETDPIIRKGYEQEIEYLKKMQNSNSVIKMYDYEYRDNELLLVLEHGDIDFAKFLSNEAKLKCLTPLKIKYYWTQMLEAVADIHKYGIVHSDLKPANFLLVAGKLKLIDFGIAMSVPEDKTSIFRDTQVGTLNYMSPEAITQMSADSKQPLFKVGVKSDVWSLGCILYNLVYGVTPFFNIKSLMQKIYAITNPNYEIPFKPVSDPLLLDVMKSCLKRNPKERASVEELLNHPYLAEDCKNSAPAAIDPNILKQMQVLTPRRMLSVSKLVQELSGKTEM